MMRQAVAVLAAFLCLVASQVYALGLGSISLESALNQPLRARIQIVDLDGISPGDITIDMASQQDFQRFDLERTNFLSNVDFSIERDSAGVFVVLTSEQAVREPYLSFILDTRWPSGRILSEHTVLLDLPVFSDARGTAEPIAQPVSPVVEDDQGLVQRPASTAVEQTTSTQVDAVAEPASSAAEPIAAEPVQAEPAQTRPQRSLNGSASLPDTLEIQESDTLWEISMRFRPDSSVSIQQTMLAIQRLNPDAFENGNINRLRAGETLQIPDLSDIESVDQQRAISEVSRQNQLADVGAQPLTALASGPSSSAAADQQGQLRVLTAEDAEPTASGASSEAVEQNAVLDSRIEALENQLMLQEEEADRNRVQQTELLSRLEDLDTQISSALEIIRLQDQQLAQLQESLAEAASEAAVEQTAVTDPAEITAATQSQPLQSSPPSFLDSVIRVLSNSSMVFGIVVVLVILLMVMLLVRRNRAVTPEGFQEEFSADLDDLEGSELVGETAVATDLDDHFPDTSEATEEEVADVAALASAAVAAEVAEFDDNGLDDDSATDFQPNSQDTAIGESADDEDVDDEGFSDSTVINDDAGTEIESGRETAEQAEEMLDFELETGLDEDQAVAGDEEVLDFDIDEFLDDDTDAGALSVDTDEASGRKESAASHEELSENSLDFDLDTEFDDNDSGTAEADQSIELETIDFGDDSSEATDQVEELDAGSDESGGAEAEQQAHKADGVTELGVEEDPEIETLDFDLSDTGIEDFDESAADSQHSTASDDDEVESFDFDFAEQDSSDSDPDTGDQEADAFESIDLDLDDLDEDTAEEAPALDAGDLDSDEIESVDIEFDDSADDTSEDKELAGASDDPTAGIDDSGAEVTETDAQEPDTALNLDNASDQEPAPAPLDEPESINPDAEVEFEAVDEPEPEEERAPETEAELESDPEPESESEMHKLAIDSELSDADQAETDELAEADPSADGADDSVDDVSEVLKQDEETDSPQATIETGELDFLAASDPDSTIDGAEEEVEFLSDDDEAATKLDLAYAYQKMGDFDGAKEILEEVINEGNDAQVNEARNLMEALAK